LSPFNTSDEESDCADARDVHKTLIATSHATALKAVYAPLVFTLTDVFGFNHVRLTLLRAVPTLRALHIH